MFDWKENSIIGLGNPLLDLIITVDKDFICKHNLKEDDSILADDTHDIIYKEVEVHPSLQHLTGGSAQNTISMLQWLINKPKVCTFLGCVGQDEDANILEQYLEKKGLHVKYQKIKDGTRTGRCAVLLNGKSRCLVTSLGACSKFSIDHLDDVEVKHCIDKAEYMYASCYFINSCHDALLTLAKRFHSEKKLFILNLGAPFLPTFFKTQVDELLYYADIVIGGGEEAHAYIMKHFSKDVESPIIELAKLPAADNKRRLVVITQGSKPTLAVYSDNFVIKEFPVVHVEEKNLVDTNGGGDAFAAGFIFEYLQKRNLEDAVKSGLKAAAYIIQRSGFCLGPREDYI